MMAQRPTNIDNTITGRSGSGNRMHIMSNNTPFRQSPPPSPSPPFVFGQQQQQQQHHYVETKSPLLQSRGDGHRRIDTTNSRSGEDGHQHHEQQQQQLNMDNMFSNNNTTSNSDHVNVDADVDSSSYNYSFDDDDNDDDNNDNDGSISSRKNNPLHSSFDDSLLLRREEEEEAERGGTTSSIGYNNTAATPFAAPKEGTRSNNNVDRTLFGNSYVYDGGRSILDDDDEDENSNFRIIDMENASFSKSNNNQNQNDPNNNDNDNDINNNHEENNTNHNSTLFSPSLPSSSSSLTGGKKNSYQHLRRPTRSRSVSGGCSQELNPNKPVVPNALGKNSTVRTKGTFTPATTRRRRRSGDTATTLSSSSFSLSSSTLSKTPTPVRTPVSTRAAAAAAAAASSSSSTAQKRRLAPSVYPARQSPMRRGGGGGGIFAAVSSSTPTRSTTVSTPFPPLALSVPNTRTGRVRSSSIGMINSNNNSNNNYGGVSIGESNKLFLTSRQQPSSSNSNSVTTTRQQQSIPRSSLKLIPQQHHGHQYSLTTATTTTTTAAAVVVGSTSKLETTFEIDADGESVETHDANTNTNTNNSPARFRFTSFPASLPRVYHQHHSSTEAATAVRMTPPVCPGSVRKRMSFDTEDDNFENNDVVSNNNGDNKTTSTAATIVVATGRDDNNNNSINNNNNAEETVYQDTNNHSRDDEGTQNTSISSLSVDGGGCGHHQHLPHLPNQHPPHFASAPLEKLLLFPGYNDDGGEEESLAAPVEAAAITGNVHNHPEESSDQIGMMGRTRLDFNVFLSPTKINNDNNNNNRHFGTKKIELNNNDDDGNRNGNDTNKNNNNNIDLSRPYEQNRSHSFPSTLSSHTHTTLMDTSNVEEISPTLSPPRTIEKNYPPETPREVQVHFPLLSECSPILGTKEHSNNTIATTTAATDDRPNNNGSSETSSSLVGDRLLPKSFGSSSHSSHFGFSIKQRENQRGEGSSASSSSGSTTTTQKRRLRPMPDMSAFENAKSGNSSRGDRSFDDGTFTAGGDSRGIPSLNHRACPPTPQRTPAWANEGGPHAFFQHRQNSLITTKVLLTCPSQVLEGRSSLEDSVLDDDSRGGNGIGVGPTGRRISLSNQKKCDRGSSIGKTIKAYNKEENEEVNEDNDVRMGLAEKCDSIDTASIQTAGIHNDKQPNIKTPQDQITAPPKLMRRLSSNTNISSVISFSNDFEILRALGSGTFADVYKVRMKSDDQLYAIKRNRRQFRGKRDRDMALAEVQSMQRLQSVFADSGTGIVRNGNSSHHSNLERNCYSLYLLFFYRAWQEDGYFFSQTELCCRDTCREMLDSLRFLWNSAKKKYPSLIKTLPAPPGVQAGSEVDTFGRLVPNTTIWKICHDILAGLSHIHSHGIVHQDIKPSNIFLVANNRFGAMCKIGDFGMAGSIGSSGDGQEGDARYMPPELLTSATRHPSSDIFSLGLTLYEIATDENVEMPSEGLQWHQLRSQNEPKLPLCHGDDLQHLIQTMTSPDAMKRPTADSILENKNVKNTGHKVDTFLKNYIADVEEYDRQEEQLLALDQPDNKTPRNNGRDIKRSSAVRSPSLTMLIPSAPTLFSPPATKYVVH